MGLQLDTRQRAMLNEMGVKVWLPEQKIIQAVNVVAEPDVVQGVQGVQVTHEVLDLQKHSAQELAQSAEQCQSCGLCKSRLRSTLKAESLAPAQWMIVGDPPDVLEEAAGQPFAGEAGKLLDSMLAATGMDRTSAYLSNVVKCRVPQGKSVRPEELLACEQYLKREIELVRPRVIISMGRWANQVLLSQSGDQANLPLGRLRGTVFQYQGVPLVVTYHPNVLLRSQSDKAKAWADLCLALDAAGK